MVLTRYGGEAVVQQCTASVLGWWRGDAARDATATRFLAEDSSSHREASKEWHNMYANALLLQVETIHKSFHIRWRWLNRCQREILSRLNSRSCTVLLHVSLL